MEKNFTLPAFAEPITALPDTPNLSASELKRRFQAPSDELREAHNALAKTVQGITDATYPETVSENMLTADLAGKINGKAEQSALDAETAAREKTDAELQTAIAQKCEVLLGSYTGTGEYSTQTISLGARPKAILVANYKWGGNYYDPQMMNLILPNCPTENAAITENGFEVKNHFNESAEDSNSANPYRYLAFL